MEELAKFIRPNVDPAPEFLKHLTPEQQKVILVRQLDVHIRATQEYLETIKMAREMIKPMVK
jgi:hypothetical protein